QNQGAAATTSNPGGNGARGGNGSQQPDQSQSASNENSTEQSASSEASSQQVNVNAPVTVDSPGSNNGDVKQSNKAENNASSTNKIGRASCREKEQSAAATGSRQGSSSSCGG